MNVSTSINVFFGQGPVSAQMKRVYDAGFRHMDINISDWVDMPSGNGLFPASPQEWQNWVQEIGDFAGKFGVTLNQAHGPLFNIFEEGPRGDHLRGMCIPSLEAAAALSIPWVVYHAGSFAGDFQSKSHVRALKEANRRFFDPLVETAEKLGVGIALENMSDRFGLGQGGRYCANTDDLIDLADSFHSSRVGICWDTGHAHIQGVDQRAELRKIGDRLKVLHIQDNDGCTDQHTAPFYGTIDWGNVLQGLRDISYAGELTFEAHTLVRRLPLSCQDAALSLLYQIGCALKGQFEAMP